MSTKLVKEVITTRCPECNHLHYTKAAYSPCYLAIQRANIQAKKNRANGKLRLSLKVRLDKMMIYEESMRDILP